jgi:hypothetical protein
MEAGILTFGGVNYNMKALDPRGIGINPDVQTMWTKYMPAGNDPTCGVLAGEFCDGLNEIGYKANLSLPLTSNDLAFRIDHAFSPKWNWFTSYRYYKLNQFGPEQVDIGGFFPGDKLGVPAALAQRPQQPWYLVTGLTTNISDNTNNDFHYSFLRNFWQWSDDNAPPQIPGLGGAMEPFGEQPVSVLAPYNVNAQDIRTRFWDGEDNFLSDNVSSLKGNHLIQFGGQYQHNYDYHQRSDNGGGINFTPTYELGDGIGSGLVDMSSIGGGFPNTTAAARAAAAVYGIVTDAQVAYTRSGSDLALNPPLRHFRSEHHSVLQCVFQRHMAYEAKLYADLWHGLDARNAPDGEEWQADGPGRRCRRTDQVGGLSQSAKTGCRAGICL